jgi:hypothetical protein
MPIQPAPSHPSSLRLSCVSCGRIIGVYEPMVVVSPWGDVSETSLAQRGEIDPDDECYHPACYPWHRMSADSYARGRGLRRDAGAPYRA